MAHYVADWETLDVHFVIDDWESSPFFGTVAQIIGRLSTLEQHCPYEDSAIHKYCPVCEKWTEVTFNPIIPDHVPSGWYLAECSICEYRNWANTWWAAQDVPWELDPEYLAGGEPGPDNAVGVVHTIGSEIVRHPF